MGENIFSEEDWQLRKTKSGDMATACRVVDGNGVEGGMTKTVFGSAKT
jgi:hypothetical protein